MKSPGFNLQCVPIRTSPMFFEPHGCFYAALEVTVFRLPGQWCLGDKKGEQLNLESSGCHIWGSRRIPFSKVGMLQRRTVVAGDVYDRGADGGTGCEGKKWGRGHSIFVCMLVRIKMKTVWLFNYFLPFQLLFNLFLQVGANLWKIPRAFSDPCMTNSRMPWLALCQVQGWLRVLCSNWAGPKNYTG